MHLVLGRNLNIFSVNFLMSWVTGYLGRVELTRKKSGRITGQPVLLRVKKIGFGSGQKFLTRIAMSTYNC